MSFVRSRLQSRAIALSGLHLQRLCSATSCSKAYNHLDVEAKWQRYWEENEVFKSIRRAGHKKKYVLDMFPYPSGSGLHVGHPEGYTATDIMARYWRMNDFDVLHPMGWDAFGLPAEQHAIQTGTHPAVTTKKNIATFKRQLKSLGFSYDWSRELSTTDEDYMRWTQWIFLKIFKRGLAKQDLVSVNWCPALGTVLANEEIINGRSERGDHPVVRMPLRQWVLRITEYAQQLERGLGEVSGVKWPEGTVQSQNAWIGRSEGASIQFPVISKQTEAPISGSTLTVFTTRPDTIMGVTYLAIAPEHPLLQSLISPEMHSEVMAYVESTAGKSDLQRTGMGASLAKTGVFSGCYVANPLTNEPVPVWVADYVLATVGTGIAMGVPAHDTRDHAFAKVFGLPIKQVVKSSCVTSDSADLCEEHAYVSKSGVICNSGPILDGLSTDAAVDKVIEMLGKAGRGEAVTRFKLRDWVFSRQRYWGEPIPIFFPVEPNIESCDDFHPARHPHTIRFDDPRPVPEVELPLRLPDMDNFQPGDDPQGCLARAVDWRYFQKNGQWFARETNTMPQWAGSCWYYLRFPDPHNSQNLFSEEASSWLPVDLYMGGSEHAVLHLLYARFWHKVLFDEGIVDHPEPFLKLVHQGLILGSDGEKMSKSKGNVVNPDEIVQLYGADVLRMFLMFMGPIEASKPWTDGAPMGIIRFRDRTIQLIQRLVSESCINWKSNAHKDKKWLEDLQAMDKAIQRVTSAIESLSFNTAISHLMVYSTHLSKLEATCTKSKVQMPVKFVEALLVMLSPFAPHVCEELWSRLLSTSPEVDAGKRCVSIQPWPQYDPANLVDTAVKYAIQIDGKVRDVLVIDHEDEFGADGSLIEANVEEQVICQVKKSPKVSKYLEGKEIKRLVFVKGKIVNIITNTPK